MCVGRWGFLGVFFVWWGKELTHIWVQSLILSDIKPISKIQSFQSLSNMSSLRDCFQCMVLFFNNPNRQRGVSAFYVFVRCPNKPSLWVLPMLFLLTDLIIITINNTTWPTRQHISHTWVGVHRIKFIGYNRMSLFATFSLGSPSKHTLRRRLPFFCSRSTYVVPTSNFKILSIFSKKFLLLYLDQLEIFHDNTSVFSTTLPLCNIEACFWIAVRFCDVKVMWKSLSPAGLIELLLWPTYSSTQRRKEAVSVSIC